MHSVSLQGNSLLHASRCGTFFLGRSHKPKTAERPKSPKQQATSFVYTQDTNTKQVLDKERDLEERQRDVEHRGAELAAKERQTRELQVEAQGLLESVSKRQRDVHVREDELRRMEQVICTLVRMHMCIL
jgi:hypothetical protein